MSEPFRILQVTPTLDTGGAERTTIEVAEAITSIGGKALVATSGGRLETQLIDVGGEVIHLPLAAKNPAVIAANGARLAHLAKVRRIDLIHARSRAPAWSALFAARRAHVPFVTTYHGIYSDTGPLKRWYNGVMARGDLVIANSHFTRAHVLSLYDVDPNKVIAIPRAVDLDVFDPQAVTPERLGAIKLAWRINDERLVAIAPARLSRWKGQDLLVRAAALVEAAAPGRVRYVLAGDAQGRQSYVDALDRAIESHGLSGLITRAGHVADMAAAFAASDLAIFAPTNLEAFGRGAIEAQAMSVPVIAPEQGGFTETVAPDETGLLFRMGDAQELAGAIVRMINAGELARKKMGAAGRARARSLYSKSALQHATLDIYRRLLHTMSS